ncbi:hypothetical protein ACRE_006170 [Hapsidospora chrysogenum ATCC 11550]|uniref:Uncharacterized protein n=1 Tax=Hapsidospora chrysogenum (strain ATCC 11550 / CBS 779.69 / DSM 880 / IAM 14645 / JCM 23072 / IMI 49137) TaxID=857340 RepID=A0A086TGK0_HAPC1|nr:hypothetical protein ACRE_006170 [Hapsidospora chrysogenum ATCC 11550]
MPWRDAPRVDFDDQPKYRWPCWNVDMDFEDLFGELHERFNTAPMFLQDPDAFHHDVAEIAHRCQNKADFLAQLQERRDQRLAELKHILDEIALLLVCGHSRKEDASHIHSFILLSRNASLDSLVRLCATFLDIKPERLDHRIFDSRKYKNQFPKNSLIRQTLSPQLNTQMHVLHMAFPSMPHIQRTTSHSSRSSQSSSIRATNGKRKRRSNTDDDDGPGSVKRPRSGPHSSSPQTSNTSHSPRNLRTRSTRATNGKRKLRSDAADVDGRSGPAKHPPPTPHASESAGRAMVDQACPVHDDEQSVGKEQPRDEAPPPATSNIEESTSRDAIIGSRGHINSLIDDKDDEPLATKEHPQNIIANGNQTDPEYGTRGSEDCGRATSIVAEGGPQMKESPILAFKLSAWWTHWWFWPV